MLSDIAQREVVFWTSYLYFLVKENWVCAMTTHHANNILLARNLHFDLDVRQWSHVLLIPLHCLWVKSNNRMRGQFECDVILFLLLFGFVHSHVRCGCCSIVCLRFQLRQIKQVHCKMSTKNLFFFLKKKKDFLEFFDNCTPKNIKPQESR